MPVNQRSARPLLRSLVVLLALAAALFAVHGARPAAATTTAAGSAPVRIMPLGDSITGSPGCWRALLWNQLQNAGFTNIDFVGTLPPQGCAVPYDGDNEGHGGYLVTNVADQNLLPGWLAATTPDVVIMHFGTNDVWNNLAPTRILAAYSTLVGQMRAGNPAMKILVAQLIPMNPSNCADCAQRVVALNQQIPAWAQSISTAQSPVTVVDQWTGFNDATDTADGVHPNDSGNAKMAGRWFTPLSAALTGTGATTGGTSAGSTTGGTTTGGSTSGTTTGGTTSGTTGTGGTTTGGTGSSGCTASFTATNVWQGGYQGSVTVTSTATSPTAQWSVTVAPGNGARLTQVWNGTLSTAADGTATVRNASWNGTLAPGASTTFGFLATTSATTTSPTTSPTATLTCTAGPS
ncbi:GDSL-type esterase/lipase family protein [Actinacidiphila acididurans]|uniref:Cellulose binding domain-containing protein n=1 Tax=Actinacidiphila acididurans TaxID=2784346 RepID=A0ABS2U2Q9_9ACTN|nr:GDSL-type esterase/lipase family protein [Actinacidiphila acididurans]MBM9509506.1 cellulose binding domain-containing protein [Actinacidiphila acididurans]